LISEEETDQLDQTCDKWRSITYSQGAEKYPK